MAKKDEKTWVKETLIPLFNRLGFFRVDSVHGTMEAGRDIVLADFDRFGLQKYFAVQAKDGDLRAKSATQEIRLILGQLETAFETPYRDPLLGTSHKISSVYLVVNGLITEAARNILYEKTGGWLGIIDLNQLSVASFISLSIKDDDRRTRMLLASNENVQNRGCAELCISMNSDFESEGKVPNLPFYPIKMRNLARYLEVGYQELAIGDILFLESMLRVGEAINFCLQKLPLGPGGEASLIAVRYLHELGKDFLKHSDRLKDGLEVMEGLPRPEPGKKFDKEFFPQ
jgi:hypothetical protein